MLKKTLKYVDLKGIPILRQLQIEEILLRHTRDNYFLVNRNSNYRAIVMGFSAKPLELLEVEKVRRDNITVLRRYTGGGTVIVDHNTFFVSIVMNDKDADTRPYPREIMTWTANALYTPVFQKLLQPGGDQFQLLEHDYIIGSKKFGGNAQTITRDRWVHHTSFLWDFDATNMEYLQLPKKRPEYRQNRKHTDFLQPLKNCITSLDDFENGIQEQLSNIYDTEKLTLAEVEQIEYDLKNKVPDFQARTKVELV